MYFLFRTVRISFISKVTRLHKAVTVANNTSLCFTILVVFLEFTSVDRAEISFMITPQNSSRNRASPVTGLKGSYEEALGHLLSKAGRAETQRQTLLRNLVHFLRIY